MFYFIRKTMDEHTHADGTTHTHADGTTHSHEGNDHAEDQFNAKKEMLLKQLLSSEARLRLNNVKMVKPELANMVENYLLGLVAQGRAPGQITDEQLKQILMSAQQPKKDFKINRI
tara:strand:+ start:232 stop:579 length:348 start_codon:yes stop_codon:yes gene_type:complete